MMHISVRLDAGLDWFLPEDRRGTALVVTLPGTTNLKDLLESLGVPHPELRALRRNGERALMEDLVADGDQIDAMGYVDAPTLVDELGRRAVPLRFVLDVHLGKLARYLRLLGLDCHYEEPWDDALLAAVSECEDRVMLTRDLGLLKRGNITYGMYVRATDSVEQAREVVARFGLRADALRTFSRCLTCNGVLADVPLASVAERVPPKSLPMIERIYECVGCSQLFWRGSHTGRLHDLLGEILAD